jgi:hypothetical protein
LPYVPTHYPNPTQLRSRDLILRPLPQSSSSAFPPC